MPFNMMIVGPTYCEKTHYLLNMLETSHKGEFDYIILLCPTILRNTTYREWKYFHDPNFIILDVDQDNVNDLLKYVVWVYTDTNTLIILDDCASGQDVKNRTSELVKLGYSGRHYGLSTIVLTQQMTSIAKPYRENISKITCFHNTNKKDMLELTNDYLNGVSSEEVAQITKDLRETRYSCLEINLRHPYGHNINKG